MSYERVPAQSHETSPVVRREVFFLAPQDHHKVPVRHEERRTDIVNPARTRVALQSTFNWYNWAHKTVTGVSIFSFLSVGAVVLREVGLVVLPSISGLSWLVPYIPLLIGIGAGVGLVAGLVAWGLWFLKRHADLELYNFDTKLAPTLHRDLKGVK